MKKRKVKNGLKCVYCRSNTRTQVYDFVNKCWVYYCETCQSPLDD